MNRFNFLGAEVDPQGVEWCFIFDSETGETLKSRVRLVSGKVAPTDTVRPAVRVQVKSETDTAPLGETKAVVDPAGDMETAEQRKVRLGGNKVPPAFLGDIRRMHLDPAKTDGKTDVTQSH